MITFTSEAVKRIASVVRRVEATPQDRTGEPLPGGPSEPEFWAWIVAPADISGTRYSWVRVYPDFSAEDPDLILQNGMK